MSVRLLLGLTALGIAFVAGIRALVLLPINPGPETLLYATVGSLPAVLLNGYNRSRYIFAALAISGAAGSLQYLGGIVRSEQSGGLHFSLLVYAAYLILGVVWLRAHRTTPRG